jgi:hypothetical protein
MTTTNSTYRIRLFHDGKQESLTKKKYEQSCRTLWNREYGEKGNIYILDEDEESEESTPYTHAVVFDQAMPFLSIDKSKVLGMATRAGAGELSTTFIHYAKKYIGRYFIGDIPTSLVKTDPQSHPFVEHFSYLTYQPPFAPIKEKTKIMSLVVPDKIKSLGNTYLFQIIKLIQANHLPIDLYFSPQNVSEPYINYAFTIIIEHTPSKCFFSPPVVEAMLHGCKPLYLGCITIEKVFTGDSIIHLGGNLRQDMIKMVDILKKPEDFYKEGIQNGVDIQNTVNLIHHLPDLFPNSPSL